MHEAPLSVYEVHLASWRPGLTYRQLADQLPSYVKDLGFTHVELMPVSEHPFGGSWGYQVTGFYAPTSRMGSPDDFRFLVDALHRAGIGVIMDWVPAHFPRDDWALAEFDGRPLYEHSDPQRAAHPDWGTLEFDYGRTEVRNFLVANATYWCEEFHIDGLRVDAVASMLYLDYSREDGQWSPNEQGGRENWDAVGFLQEMNATVYRRNPGVVTIAEESTAWDGVTRPTDGGGLGFGLKWNMGWMHDSLLYVAKEPVHRKYHHNEMTFSMVYAYSENYVLPISHDEVVHGKRALVAKMPGDWWQQRANHRAYLGFMWAHPGKQLLFMGQEFAQGAEWSEGHGPDWWLLDPSYEASGDHRGVRDLVGDLNAVYGAVPALWQRDTVPEGFSWVDGGAAEDNVFAFLRYDADGSPLLAVSHFSPVVRHDYRLGVPETGTEGWVEVLNTDAARYGGSDVRNEEPLKAEAEAVPAHGRAGQHLADAAAAGDGVVPAGVTARPARKGPAPCHGRHGAGPFSLRWGQPLRAAVHAAHRVEQAAAREQCGAGRARHRQGGVRAGRRQVAARLRVAPPAVEPPPDVAEPEPPVVSVEPPPVDPEEPEVEPPVEPVPPSEPPLAEPPDVVPPVEPALPVSTTISAVSLAGFLSKGRDCPPKETLPVVRPTALSIRSTKE